MCLKSKGTLVIISSHRCSTLKANAIAAGNAVVIKPSEMTPACSALTAELCERYFDHDVVRVINGGVEETTKVCDFPYFPRLALQLLNFDGMNSYLSFNGITVSAIYCCTIQLTLDCWCRSSLHWKRKGCPSCCYSGGETSNPLHSGGTLPAASFDCMVYS